MNGVRETELRDGGTETEETKERRATQVKHSPSTINPEFKSTAQSFNFIIEVKEVELFLNTKHCNEDVLLFEIETQCSTTFTQQLKFNSY